MNMKRMKKALSCILCMVLIVAMALVTTGCSGSAGNSKVTAEETTASSTAEVTVLGEGSKQFQFGVVDLEKNETWFEIHTDEETVGAALLKLELIIGEEGPYGLYVKEVNGISADYDKDKVYWAFYVNDDYGATGVDMTEIEEGTVYSFRIAK
ncbi:MAG: DUF4430 domain-containing protein [Lachnospiraceae bacterium]|nr:DUF4430 domain-containing protein [Lachnospiraceae bacterium]